VPQELDELKAKAMGAMADLPENVDPVVKSIVDQDYAAVIAYLDQVGNIYIYIYISIYIHIYIRRRAYICM